MEEGVVEILLQTADLVLVGVEEEEAKRSPRPKLGTGVPGLDIGGGPAVGPLPTGVVPPMSQVRLLQSFLSILTSRVLFIPPCSNPPRLLNDLVLQPHQAAVFREAVATVMGVETGAAMGVGGGGSAVAIRGGEIKGGPAVAAGVVLETRPVVGQALCWRAVSLPPRVEMPSNSASFRWSTRPPGT